MSVSLDFLSATDAEFFLTNLFGGVSFQKHEDGHICVLPDYFKISDVGENRGGAGNQSDGGLSKLDFLKGAGPSKQESALSLAKIVASESIIIRHIPKETDGLLPSADILYRTIKNRDPLHNKHDSPDLLDFNPVQLISTVESKATLVGSTGSELNPYFHMHITPA